MPPLLLINSLVLGQQVIQVDATVLKGLVTEMMNISVTSYDRAKTAKMSSSAIIVILEIADSKAFVKQADTIDDFAADEQTEPDKSVGCKSLFMVLLAPLPREAVQSREVVVGRLNLLLGTANII